MAGVKGRSGGARKNSGGARPGAGRKTLVVKEVQEANRSTILRLVADARWEKIVLKAASQAEDGDPIARAWLSAYVAGKPPDESKIDLNVSGQVQFVPLVPPTATT
jgi:hypothetical protein